MTPGFICPYCGGDQIEEMSQGRIFRNISKLAFKYDQSDHEEISYSCADEPYGYRCANNLCSYSIPLREWYGVASDHPNNIFFLKMFLEVLSVTRYRDSILGKRV